MIWQDRQFLQKCRDNQLTPELYQRYVDDSNFLSRAVEPGKTFNRNDVITDIEMEESERDKKADEKQDTYIKSKSMDEIGQSEQHNNPLRTLQKRSVYKVYGSLKIITDYIS